MFIVSVIVHVVFIVHVIQIGSGHTQGHARGFHNICILLDLALVVSDNLFDDINAKFTNSENPLELVKIFLFWTHGLEGSQHNLFLLLCALLQYLFELIIIITQLILLKEGGYII